MNPQLIGNRVKMLMTVNNIKRRDLAKQMGISYNTLTKKINGQREFCIDEILKIKEIFNLDLETFANVFFNAEFLGISDKKVI